MSSPVRQEKVTIIDDDPDILNLVSRFLNNQPYQVTTYKNPRVALDEIRGQPPDLVITDLQMGELTGIEVLREVKQNLPETVVVMLTASNEVKDAINALRYGAADYVLKPVKKDQLFEVINKALYTGRLERLNRQYVETLRTRDAELKMQLSLAQQIQKCMLPDLPKLEGFELAVHIDQSDSIGGDLLDVFRFREQHLLGILLSDLTGHGIPAALLATMLKVTAKGLFHPGKDERLSMLELNNQLTDSFPLGNFSSSIYLMFDGKKRQITAVKGGIEPGLLIKAESGEIIEIELKGTLLGLRPLEASESPYEKQTYHLKKDDLIILFTDGVTEVFDEKDRLVGLDGLKNALAEVRNMSARQVVDFIVDFSRQFRPHRDDDDLTVFVARCL